MGLPFDELTAAFRSVFRLRFESNKVGEKVDRGPALFCVLGRLCNAGGTRHRLKPLSNASARVSPSPEPVVCPVARRGRELRLCLQMLGRAEGGGVGEVLLG